MKKSFKTVGLCAIAFCVALASCTKEEDFAPVTENEGQNGPHYEITGVTGLSAKKRVTINAQLPGSESKSIIDANGHVIWDLTDTIMVNTVKLGDPIIDPNNPAYATFKGSVGAVADRHYWALNPASIGSTSAEDYSDVNVKVTIPGTQKHRGDTIQNYMVGHIESTGLSLNMNFKNLFSIMRLTVQAKDGKTGAAAKLSHIEINSESEPLSGVGVVYIENGLPVVNFSTDAKKAVKYDCGKMDITNEKTVNILIPAGTYSKLTVKFYDGDNNYVQKSLTNKTFQRSMYHKLGKVTVDAKKQDPYLQAEYSVSATQKVTFALGNLQWSAYGNGGNQDKTTHVVAGGGTKDGTFRIAEHQWDYVGRAGDNTNYPGNVKYLRHYKSDWKWVTDSTLSENSSAGKDYQGWIDLFCFGASGYNGMTPYEVHSLGQDIAGTYYDWGVYNAIRCGSDEGQPGTWRVLTKDEWAYLMNMNDAVNGRQGSRFTMAMVHDVKGFLIYPDQYDTTAYDDWMVNGTHPSGRTKSGLAGMRGINQHGRDADGYPTSKIPDATWTKMEKQGVLFLPVTSSKNHNDYNGFRPYAHYWTSTYYGSNMAWNTHICRQHTALDEELTNSWFAVRLVKDIAY